MVFLIPGSTGVKMLTTGKPFLQMLSFVGIQVRQGVISNDNICPTGIGYVDVVFKTLDFTVPLPKCFGCCKNALCQGTNILCGILICIGKNVFQKHTGFCLINFEPIRSVFCLHADLR